MYDDSMFCLSDEERKDLKQRHKQERDRRICDRIKAVLLYDKDWTLEEIAEALLLTEESIRHHIDEYKAFKKLKPEGGGSQEKLSETQANLLEKHLEEHIYLYVKDISEYVSSTFGIRYTVHGLRNWLQKHGFSYKKPAVIPGKADKAQQEEWIAKYNEMREKLPEDETICFTDGVHPTHNVQPAYGWIKKGVRKEIPSNTGRSRINLSGLIDIISHNVIVKEDKTLNAEATIQFFQKIEASYPLKNKIHVFCDNARYYRNKNVHEYLESSKIELHFLPPYSPNLNPIERLWKWMKERVIYNAYYECFEDFKSAVMGFFDILPTLSKNSTLGKEFRSKIRDKFRTIGPPLPNF